MTGDVEYWRRRALRAEGAVGHVLWVRPMAYQNESAEELVTRIHQDLEHTYRDVAVRCIHQPVSVYWSAAVCGCEDDGSNSYERDHVEESDNGDLLCDRRPPLGRICTTCEDEDGDGPEWASDRVEWPCPPVRRVDAIPSDVETLTAMMAR